MLNAKVAALTNAALIAMFSGLYDDAERVLATRTALMRENAKVVGTEAFSNIQETQIAFFDGQLAAWRGDYKAAAKLAKKTSELVAGENNPRKMEPYHELLGLIALRQKNYKKAVTELRLADQTQLHNKYLLAQALEATNAKDEAQKLYKEVAVNNFNTVDFALLRAEAFKKDGLISPAGHRGRTDSGAAPFASKWGLTPFLRGFLDQAFGFHGFLHFRTRGDARLELLERRPLAARSMPRKLVQFTTVNR